jgi:hypothetical protein
MEPFSASVEGVAALRESREVLLSLAGDWYDQAWGHGDQDAGEILANLGHGRQ